MRDNLLFPIVLGIILGEVVFLLPKPEPKTPEIKVFINGIEQHGTFDGEDWHYGPEK